MGQRNKCRHTLPLFMLISIPRDANSGMFQLDTACSNIIVSGEDNTGYETFKGSSRQTIFYSRGLSCVKLFSFKQYIVCCNGRTAFGSIFNRIISRGS